MNDDEALIQQMFDAFLSCCADLAADEACRRCRLLSRASRRIAGLSEQLRIAEGMTQSLSRQVAALVEDGDRMRATLHDLAFAAPTVGDEHRNAKGWLHPDAWGAYVSRVQKMAGGAIRRPPTDRP